MSIPKEPRQIMINLMYLVLTAMLALNVTSEILNAFKVLSRSLDASNTAIDFKTSATYQAFLENEKAPGRYERVHPYRLKADAVKDSADEMVRYLKIWQRRIIIQSGGWNPKDSSLVKEEDIDATTTLLVEKKGGDTLRSKINSLRKFLLGQISHDSAAISRLMPLKVEPAPKTDNNPEADWNIGYFEHMPAVAAVAMFSKFQNDVRTSEQLVINTLFEEAHLTEEKFDTIAAIAVPRTNYALDGDIVKADILFAAFNRNNKPILNITQGGGSHKEAINGVVPWEVVASGTGLQTVKGQLSLKTEHGVETRPFSFEYMVGNTGSSVGIDKMNVFYAGIPNPVTIAAAGYSVQDVKLADIPNGTISGEKGHFIINMSKTGDITLNVMAKTKEGATKKIGEHKVRVKMIPDPIAMVGGMSQGDMAASKYRIQIAPVAVMPVDFEFEVSFKIISFQYFMLPKGGDVIGPYNVGPNMNGCRFEDNKDLKFYKSRAKPGDKVFIQFIKAIGPDNKVRTLNPITLSLF